MRKTRYIAGALTAIVLAGALWVVPVQATVHEIVGQWCSGQDELFPPGLSREGSKNFARPLFAARVIVESFDEELGGILVTFNYDHPAIKVQSSGLIVPIGETDDGTPIFLDVPEPNPDFPAFQHCPKLAEL